MFGRTISVPLLEGKYEKALETAKKYSKIFKDNFFIELQRNGMKSKRLLMKDF
jgi:DNA polymerase III alpha subunit